MEAPDLSKIPISPPPPGQQSNFINPPSLKDAAFVVAAVVIPFQIFSVFARFYASHIKRNLRAWDNWFSLFATAITIGFISLSLNSTHFARHEWDIPVSYITDKAMKAEFAQEMLMTPMLLFAKSTLLLLYYRVFSPRPSFRLQLYLTFGFLAITMLAAEPMYLAMCLPSKGKDWVSAAEKCVNAKYYAMVQGPANIITDLLIFYLPIPVILELNLPKKTRWQIFGVFSTGLFVLVASIVGMVYRVDLFKAVDPQWAGYICFLCAYIESSVSIICSSMPAMRHMFKHISETSTRSFSILSPFIRSSRSKSYGNTNESTSQLPYNTFDAASKRTPSECHDNSKGGLYFELSESIEHPLSTLPQDQKMEHVVS